MNNEEARAILKKHMTRYEKQNYQELLRLLDEQDTFDSALIAGEVVVFPQPAGAPEDFKDAPVFQVEIQAVWDDKSGGVLRIIGNIDDGGWRAWLPLSDSFLVEPDSAKS